MWHTRSAGPYDPKHWFGPPFNPKFFHRMRHHWRTFMPYVLEEMDTEYIVTMPLPGFDVKNLDVSVKENFIYVKAKKSSTEETSEDRPRKIRSMGEFFWNRPEISVKIYIPQKIKAETVKAKLAKGLLTITVEREPGTKVDIEE